MAMTVKEAAEEIESKTQPYRYRVTRRTDRNASLNWDGISLSQHISLSMYDIMADDWEVVLR
jgi:hypothetical protein